MTALSFKSLLTKEVETFFDGERLLWWLEALALMKSLSDSIITFSSTKYWFSVCGLSSIFNQQILMSSGVVIRSC